jgi:hypothetical protein
VNFISRPEQRKQIHGEPPTVSLPLHTAGWPDAFVEKIAQNAAKRIFVKKNYSYVRQF